MKVHFIAIGGAAMHNIAIALHLKGFEVSGSDDNIYEPSKSRLRSFGLLPTNIGWNSDKITPDIDAIILGMHAKLGNPELSKAQKLGLKIYSYPEFIYEQSKDKTRVVISGSHGKTTITAMILHVLNYYDKTCDFMLGAQLEGFDIMAHLTDENDFILLEGDEYLSSAIDLSPKFHHYKPNIALLSGIAWDHINVFPTFDNYLDQFSKFITSIVDGGSITFNEEDKHVAELVSMSNKSIRRFPYSTPAHFVENGITYLETDEGPLPLEIFGSHNLNNLSGAKWICQQMGIDQNDFFEAISTFPGASKRLERIFQSESLIVFKDFAHSPSKVDATTKAVKLQYPSNSLLVCLELHTFSSLNLNFIKQYENSLNKADTAVVFYSINSLEAKGMTPIPEDFILQSFKHPNLTVITDPLVFQGFLKDQNYINKTLLFISSGNFAGFDFNLITTIVK